MRRQPLDMSTKTSQYGFFLAGNRLLSVERSGRQEILGPGEPFPEAETIPPRRLRLMLERGDAIFVPHQSVSKDTVRTLVLGMTKAAKEELKGSLGVELDKELTKEDEAELLASALIEVEAFTRGEEIRDGFAKAREPKARSKPDEAPIEAHGAVEIPPPDEWKELGLELLEELFATAAELEVERAIKEAGLLAQVIGRLQETELLAKKKKIARIESFTEAAAFVVRTRLFEDDTTTEGEGEEPSA
jgi:hypothetical protein